MGRKTNKIETVIEGRRWFYYDTTNESDVEYVRKAFEKKEDEDDGNFESLCNILLQHAHECYIAESINKWDDDCFQVKELDDLIANLLVEAYSVPNKMENYLLYPCFINDIANMIIERYVSECAENSQEDIEVYASQISKICKKYFTDKITVVSLCEEDIQNSIEKYAIGKTKSKGIPFFLLFYVIIEKTYKEIYEMCNNQKAKVNELAFEIGILDNETLQKILHIPYLERTGKWANDKSFGFVKLYETVTDIVNDKKYDTLEEVIEARHCLYDAYFAIMEMLQKANCNEIVSVTDWQLKEDIYQYLYCGFACHVEIQLRQNFLIKNWLFEYYYKGMLDDEVEKRQRFNIKIQFMNICSRLLEESEIERLRGDKDKINPDRLMTYICKRYNEEVSKLGDKSFCLQKQNNMNAAKNKPYKCLFAVLAMRHGYSVEFFRYIAANIADIYEKRKTRKTTGLDEDFSTVLALLEGIRDEYMDIIFLLVENLIFDECRSELDYIMEMTYDAWWDILIEPEIFRETKAVCQEPKMGINDRVVYPTAEEWKTAIARLNKKYENFDFRGKTNYVLKWLDS